MTTRPSRRIALWCWLSALLTGALFASSSCSEIADSVFRTIDLSLSIADVWV
jgi:hypothetical protein